MARLSVDFYSTSLMRTTTLDVILPTDCPSDAMGFDYMRRQDPASWDRTPMPAEKPPFKALFLLHGISGNHTDFMSETRIRTFAEERGLAVIMPSGYNAFYLDHPETHNYYGRYVGLELVEAARRMFPISRRREDTFIGGISMGAYGALRNGFKYAENFGGIIALSSAMILGDFDRLINDDVFFLSRNFLESTFGDLTQVIDSDKDPRRLAVDVVYCDRPRPRVFMAWGSNDPLAEPNRALAERLRGTGIEVEQREMPGGHDWTFWNTALPQALDWLPR